tara:strand:+ start:1065 stop:1352 length:288 start_codon:yes stop_codon:yes gene_type:complete
MNIELGILHDGGVMMVSDTPLPDMVCRVEYYRDQRLFMLIYDDNVENDDDLMHYEVPEHFSKSVENTPNIIIYSLFPNREPLGYKVPLIMVGDVF